MPIEPDQICLRAAVPADCDFVVRVTEGTMRAYAEKTWGTWDNDLTRKFFDPATYFIVQVNGEDAGCMQVLENEDHFHLNVLYLQPAAQNRNIGSVLLKRLIARAEAAAKPVRLRVLRVNPAQRFYARHGFVITASTKERLFMTRPVSNR